jgi:uncharacterized RDD family membrane protein YckC
MSSFGDAEGVCFRQQDYVGFWKRLLIDAIDLLVIFLLWLAILLVFSLTLTVSPESMRGFSRPLLLGIGFLYLVLAKWSRWGTLGYRIGRARIVNFRGEHPGLGSLTIRFVFFVLGPLLYLSDLIWVGGDPQRQALRDKFAHTYVVHAQAVSIGRGRIICVYYYLLGWTMLFQEVSSESVANVP